LNTGQYENALADLNRAFELTFGPLPAGLYVNRAKVFAQTGQPEKELRDIEMVLRTRPSDEWAQKERARLLQRVQAEKAVK
jgi:Tfp pilus assembly protein PilF